MRILTAKMIEARLDEHYRLYGPTPIVERVDGCPVCRLEYAEGYMNGYAAAVRYQKEHPEKLK